MLHTELSISRTFPSQDCDQAELTLHFLPGKPLPRPVEASRRHNISKQVKHIDSL